MSSVHDDVAYVWGDVRLPTAATSDDSFYVYTDARPGDPVAGDSVYIYFDERGAPPGLNAQGFLYAYGNVGVQTEPVGEDALYAWEHVQYVSQSTGGEAVNDYTGAASIYGVALRVTQLDANGAPVDGDHGSYVHNSFISLGFTPQYTDATDVMVRDGNGVPAGSLELPAVLESVTVTLSVCDCDPLLTMMLTGGSVYYSEDGTASGYGSPLARDQVGQNVALEMWSVAVNDGSPGYYRWLIPLADLQLTGEMIFTEEGLATQFTGYGWGNANFGAGPEQDWPYISDRPYQYARDAAPPLAQHGYPVGP